MPLVSNVRKRKLRRVGFRLANIAHVFRNAGMKEAHWTTTQTEKSNRERGGGRFIKRYSVCNINGRMERDEWGEKQSE